MVVFHKDIGDFMGTCSIVPMDKGSRWDLGYALHKNIGKKVMEQSFFKSSLKSAKRKESVPSVQRLPKKTLLPMPF